MRSSDYPLRKHRLPQSLIYKNNYVSINVVKDELMRRIAKLLLSGLIKRNDTGYFN